MTELKLTKGVDYDLPEDLGCNRSKAKDVLEHWNALTPLARNDWIYWIISTKKAEARKQHIERLCNYLLNGKRRPCCWPGCLHH